MIYNGAVQRRDLTIAVLLLTGFVGLYLFTASMEELRWGDSGAMLSVAERIWDYGFGRAPDDHRVAAFTKFGLGQSLIDLPVAGVYKSARHAEGRRQVYLMLAVSILGALIGAASNVLVFVVLRQLRYRPHVAVVAALICGTTTMMWVYTQSLFSDSTIGLCCMIGLACLLAYRRGGRGWLVGAGAAAMYAALCKPVMLPMAVAFLVYAGYLIRKRQGGQAMALLHWMLVPMAVIFAVMLWFNRLRYGHVLAFGYGEGRDFELGFATPMLVGLYGLLFSSGKGFFFYNPTLILSLIGWRRFRHRHRPEALLILVLALLMLGVYASWWSWSGDWAWGPRFLVCLVPLLSLCLAPVLERVPLRSVKAAALAALVMLSAAIQISGLVVHREHHIRYVLQGTGVFAEVIYDPADWPIRDDSLQLHFIPEFSPLVGHWWVLRCMMHRDDPQLLEALLRSPPWRGLNSKWVPAKVDMRMLDHHVWWLRGHGGGGIAFGMAFIAAAALAGAWFISRRDTPGH